MRESRTARIADVDTGGGGNGRVIERYVRVPGGVACFRGGVACFRGSPRKHAGKNESRPDLPRFRGRLNAAQIGGSDCGRVACFRGTPRRHAGKNESRPARPRFRRRLNAAQIGGSDCDPDVTAGGETAGLDQRYFVSYDDAGLARALTGYTSGGGGSNGRVIERYVRIPGVGTLTLVGDAGSGETGAAAWGSTVGNPVAPVESPDGGPDYLTWCDWNCWNGYCHFNDCSFETAEQIGVGSGPAK